MKTLSLMAVLVALATPAWAENVDEDLPGGWRDKARLCQKVTKPAKIIFRGEAQDDFDMVCWLRHAPEAVAIELATSTVADCKPGSEHRLGKLKDAPPEAVVMWDRLCAETLPYIKQRWGY